MIKEKIINATINKKAENIANDIIKNSKNQKSYGTSLLFEHYLVGSLDKMNTQDLEQLRYLITKIIRERLRKEKIIESTKNKTKSNDKSVMLK